MSKILIKTKDVYKIIIAYCLSITIIVLELIYNINQLHFELDKFNNALDKLQYKIERMNLDEKAND